MLQQEPSIKSSIDSSLVAYMEPSAGSITKLVILRTHTTLGFQLQALSHNSDKVTRQLFLKPGDHTHTKNLKSVRIQFIQHLGDASAASKGDQRYRLWRQKGQRSAERPEIMRAKHRNQKLPKS